MQNEQRDPLQTPRTVLCVAAHPDDEILGVGGTLALHAAAGRKVIIVILSEGEKEKKDGPPNLRRRESALEAAKILKAERVVFHDFPDQRLDTLPLIELIHPLEEILEKYHPGIVYTHHAGDANTDHQVTFQATYAACRPLSRSAFSVNRLLTYETPSSTEQAPQTGEFVFRPNCFINIETVWQKKLRALQCYTSELHSGNHPRNPVYLEALARMRGGYAGFALAEAFMLLRERIDPAGL